ncbi:hypothetical protein [Alloacidobacterium sp.]|uniref:hypothetical protein n=1 Tax=Alloacidobacterium sp. TaxID=2951999 RepID=UPI002D4F7081|nr:hypothetical protein [Alloacidobacterium sp.]HYK35387.1 hypothetical protein [Alloacidobacterium sp.]
MRRSAIWFLIAVLWFVVTIITALHQGWRLAWFQALIALVFLAVAISFRRKEKIR